MNSVHLTVFFLVAWPLSQPDARELMAIPALAKDGHGWLAVLSLGFGIDRNGIRRKPLWSNIVTLGVLLPGFAMRGQRRGSRLAVAT
jgi:hypothetical protein